MSNENDDLSLEPIPLAGLFLLKAVCKNPHVYRFDGEYWFIRSCGRDYWLTEREFGFVLIESPL